ncbi:MAG: nuclear transport factor 2 family protein [Puniceicoccaceae bacterium]
MKFENSQKVLQAWLDAVHSGDLEAVGAMYADDAVLIPTFSRKYRTCCDSRRDYFSHVSTKPGLRVEVLDESVTEQRLGNSLYVLGGLYNWFNDSAEGEQVVLARFTYVIDLESDGPIVHHHSSECPAT